MRLILSILFLLFTLQNFATVYYVSTSGSNGNPGTSPSTPWQTLAFVNSKWSTFNPGDQILFRRGETFYGTLVASKSGAAGNPITIGAYDVGAKPLITAMTLISGTWTNKGGGIWESPAVSSLLSTLNIVSLNGVVQPIGRYPNANAANAGYLTLDSAYPAGSKTSMRVSSLPTSPNWAGAEIVVRTRNWVLDRSIVQTYSGSVINFSPALHYAPYQKFGYFFQNDIKTLDVFGEWCFNATTKKISMFFGSNVPSSYIIAASNVGNPVDLKGFSYINLDNLHILGANDNGLTFGSGSHVRVTNTDVEWSGITGIAGNGTKFSSINNCSVYNSLGTGIKITGATNDSVMNSYIYNSSVIAGMGQGGDEQGNGMYVSGSGTYYYNDKVIKSGYNGIEYLAGSNNSVLYCTVDSFGFVKDDAGGIYTYNSKTGDTPKQYTNNVIKFNIVRNGIGAYKGTRGISGTAYGIYLDGKTQQTEVANNIIYNNTAHGLFLNNNRYVNAHDNTFYDNPYGAEIRSYDNSTTTLSSMGSNRFTNNMIFVPNTTGRALYFETNYSDVQNFGVIDNNFYCRPLLEPSTIGANGMIKINKLTNVKVNRVFSLDKWQDTMPIYDAHTIKTAKPISNASEVRFEFNPHFTDTVISLNGKTYVSASGTESFKSGSLTLKPFTAKILLVTPGVPVDNSNPLPTVSITFPSSGNTYTQPLNQTINATATDADGIRQVDFYAGNTFLGTDNTSPYSYVWNSVPVGNNIQLTAVAIDAKGGINTSSPVSISVVAPNQAPSIGITSPANNSTFLAPSNISITTNAADADGFITSVKFYNGSTLLATVTSAPFNYTWSGVAAGSYTLTAIATDDKGLSTTSAAANISVRALVAPNVNITSPTNNSNYISPASITLSATASDIDGTIQKVEFYNGNTLIFTDLTAPYSYTLTNVTVGTYNLMAKAYDDDNLSSTSSVVTIVSAPTKTAPTSTIVTPANGYTTTDPASIGVNVNATDADGTIVRVELYQNGNLIATDNSAPFVFIASSVMAGNYAYTAKAIDNDSLFTVSTPVNVTVTHVNTAPVLELIEPANNDSAIGQFRMTATATDNDGAITKVEFFNGTTLLGTATTLPYTLDISLPIGTYTLSAKATDNNGATTTKSINYKVINPAPGDPIKVKGFKGVIK